MRRSQKSKRLTWASDVNLCQVRLFLSEDSPSQVGSSGTQDQLQGKVSWAEQQQLGVGSYDNLPPGFEGIIQPSNLWGVNLSQIPLIKWKFPPRFLVNSDWRVVAGEESSETEAQNQRELRVLEAIYPRPSAIPPNPTPPADDSIHNDQNTPLVPITPIEDEDSASDGASSANNTPMTPQKAENFSSAGTTTPDIAAVAKAALATITSNNEIDRDLLVKILSDPKMVEQLVKNRTASSTMPNTPMMHNVPPPRPPISMNHTPSATTQYNTPHVGPMPRSSFDLVNVPSPKTVNPTISATASPFYPQSTIRPFANVRPPVPDVITPPSSSLPIPVKKDINYYKSLIQQHGAEKRENLPQFGTSQEQMSKSLIQQHGVERRDVLPHFTHQSNQQLGTSQELSNFTQSKPKIMKKPCIYFNTSRGCRNGANCLYQHDVSTQQRVSGISDVQSAKRVKLDREITGT